MPYVIAAGLALLAIGNLLHGLRGDLPARESAIRKAILLILGGLAALIAIIGFGGGFILGDHHPVRHDGGGVRPPRVPRRPGDRLRARRSSST